MVTGKFRGSARFTGRDSSITTEHGESAAAVTFSAQDVGEMSHEIIAHQNFLARIQYY